ncbi:MAG: class I SAM-dependent methyltransferase [Anaerolineales bacterium]|nr:class I SAM-dependent methyltransferase [Anaerolineales bacterium]
MDKWKFFDITHREHTLCNPMSIEKLAELIALLRLKPGAQVLEIATGKGEFIIRLAERYKIEGIGVDLSPYFVSDAGEKCKERVPDAQLTFLEMDGADYAPKKPESFDLVACIGASWIYGGHEGTLKALNEMAAPGGWVVVGEPYWRHEPAAEFLEAIGEERSMFGMHYENVEAGQEIGLEVVYTLVSNQDDWDRYEALQWYAATEWAGEHADDPDVEEVLNQVRKNRENYLRWGRETFGWSIYVFKKAGAGRRQPDQRMQPTA